MTKKTGKKSAKPAGKKKLVSRKTPGQAKPKKEKKVRANPAMQTALKAADKTWGVASKAPLAGFEELPVGTYIGRVGMELRAPSGGPMIRWNYTVIKGAATGRTASKPRWPFPSAGIEEERTLTQQRLLAGDIETLGYKPPASLATELEPLAAKVTKEAKIVKFDVAKGTGDNSDRTYVNVRTVLTEEEANAIPDEDVAGAGADAAGEAKKPRCFGEFEADVADCQSCNDKVACQAATPAEAGADAAAAPEDGGLSTYAVDEHVTVVLDGDEFTGTVTAYDAETKQYTVKFDDGDESDAIVDAEIKGVIEGEAPAPAPAANADAKPEQERAKCYGEYEEDHEDCKDCEDAADCKIASKGGAGDNLPDDAELLALCQEWDAKVPKAIKAEGAAGIMKWMHEECTFPKDGLSESELNLLERFPEELAVAVE